ncbi:MAG: hypothetical protein H6613_13210 [Ignavibacteriales bacterium]|nr:hypothetical protein [Ignavibacteriales bacterium]
MEICLTHSPCKNDLNTGVNLKPGKYFPAEVPGTIHTDLYKNKIIEDPFYSDNELKLQWISQNDWVYKTEFDLSENNSFAARPCF